MPSRVELGAEFGQHEQRGDGAQIAGSLCDGLTVLRDAFLARVHSDVQKTFGMDSMLVPVSALKTEDDAKLEIDLFQLAESAAEVAGRRYVGTQDDWYLQWLARLRFGDKLTTDRVAERLAKYAARTPDDRRRSFSRTLERTLPEAQRAPLIVYRLLPLAVALTTALTFGDQAAATEARNRQLMLLPGIADCRQCRGLLLEIGEKCPQCGNPFWKYDWLTAE